jgi:hypothetical protein
MPGIARLPLLAVVLDPTPAKDPPTFGDELDELVHGTESKRGYGDDQGLS